MRTRTKLLLTAGVLGVIGLLVVLATGAFFSATTTAEDNIAATGSMSIDCTSVTTPGPPNENTNATVCGDIFAQPGPTTMKPVATGFGDEMANLAAARLPSATIAGDLTVHVGTTLRVDKLVLSQPSVGAYAGSDPALAPLLSICIGDSAVDAVTADDPDGAADLNGVGDCDIYHGPFVMAATPTAYDVATPAPPLVPGDTRTFEFEVWFPDDGVTNHNALQNKFTSANFMLTAT